MKYLKMTALAVALFALAACQQAARQDTAVDEAAIRELGVAWETAYNLGDAAAIARLYADDAVLQPPGAPIAAGPAAIQQFLAGEIAEAQAAGLVLDIHDISTIGVSGDLAYDAGTYSVTDPSGATLDTGKYLAVFRKSGDTWEYLRDTWNSDAPPVVTETAPATQPPTG